MVDTPDSKAEEEKGLGASRSADTIAGGEARGHSGEPASTATKPPVMITNQYVKDLSFEAPGVPGIFDQLQAASPEIGVNINVQAKQVGGDRYEVTLHTRAECKAGNSTAFLVELAYAGLFTLAVAQEHLRPVLLIECPRLLFPFARHVLANTVRDGGFPPLMLGPIDFVGMYQRQLQEQAAESAVPARDPDMPLA
jgi:preprotein translocase subunit SecB